MQTITDSISRSLVPRPLREAVGLETGFTVAFWQYKDGLQVVSSSRTARLEEEGGVVLVATGESVIDDEAVFGLLDSGRR